MKKTSLMFISLFTSCIFLHAQDKYYTKTGKIFFECTKSPAEKIEAVNKSGTCVLDTKTGSLQFSLLMSGFEFERALMQEHFNENYAESSKFPKSIFKGQIINNNEINYNHDGEYKARVKGQLQIHGETKDIETSGAIIIKQGKIITNARFNILCSDYKIRIPSLVGDKVSNDVNISIACTLEQFKN